MTSHDVEDLFQKADFLAMFFFTIKATSDDQMTKQI